MRRPPARADPPRRLGLSDPQARTGARAPAAARGAGDEGLPGARDRAAAPMTTSVLGIADGRALGGSLRVVVTRPQCLAAAKAAVDDVVAAIDLAASRFRNDSKASELSRATDRVVKVSPLLARAIGVALRGAEL